LEVQIMGKQQRARRNRPLNAFLAGLVHVVRDHVIGPVRRRAGRRARNEELARLDERTLRDIGLTRAQVRAAAYGLVRLGDDPARRGSCTVSFSTRACRTCSASGHQPLAAGPHAVMRTPL
jgi:uncharacterized protein YjiS (DUF1127 family)